AWEGKGRAVAIEVGRQSLGKSEVVVRQGAAGESKSAAVVARVNRLKSKLEQTQLEMVARAEKALKQNTFAIARLEDAREGINKMGWCGRRECGLAVAQRTGMDVLGTPYYREAASGKCIVCGEPATQVLYAAKVY